jgi:D-alanine-D-alanine ligase
VKGELRDLLAEQGVIACAQAMAGALQAARYRVALVPVHSDVELAMAPFPPTEWTVFNLGEGLEGRLFEEARIAWALEAMGYRFTGSDGDAIARSVNKARAKASLVAGGVPTPPWWLFRHPDEVDTVAATEYPFPLIVKPLAEDASLGIKPEAVVHTVHQLRDRIGYIVERYCQAALAEAFIAGREFNISLWGDPPEVLPLAEIDFSAFPDPYARIVSYAAKWEVQSFEYHHTPVVCPAPVAPALADQIATTARRAWAVIGCRGYARVDMRLADDGTAYVVEVNCNPDLSPDAGFYRAAQAAGYDYLEMIVHILEVALRQQHPYDRDSRGTRRSANPEAHSQHRCLQADRGNLRGRIVERLPETR